MKEVNSGTNILIDHYKNPRNKGSITSPDLTGEAINRKCGDKLVFSAIISEGKLLKIRYQGEGCFYCLVSASIACNSIEGQSLEAVRGDISRIRSWLFNDDSPGPENPEIIALGEIKKFPMRIDCVDLAWKGLMEMFR